MREIDLRLNLKKGDPEAFRYLFREYYAGLCTYAYKFTRDKVAAEDVVHDTIVKLWEKRESLEITDTVIGYLFRAVQNSALNYLKYMQVKTRFNSVYTQYLKDAQDYFTITQETGQSVIIAKELESKIIAAINDLPEQCREIFKLSRIDGMKNKEIALAKNITINTVQKQISIALDKLRQSLKLYFVVILILTFCFALVK